MSQIRVLVAEDEALVADAIMRLLEDRGFTVVGFAADGSQAFHMTRSLRPDVVLMDLNMPGMDGIEATREIQRSCPTPVVMLTAHDSTSNLGRALDAGVSGYLVKPPDPGTVERAIKVALDAFTKSAILRQFSEELQLQGIYSELLSNAPGGRDGRSSTTSRAASSRATSPADASTKDTQPLPVQRLTDPLVSVSSLRLVVSALQRHGVDNSALRALGIGRVLVGDLNSRVPLRLATRIWQEGARLSGDENLGLSVAKSIKPGDFQTLEYAVRSSATLGEGMQRLARHYPVLSEAAGVEILPAPGGSRLRFEFIQPMRHRVEFTLAAAVLIARQSTGTEWSPLDVRFAHSPPADVEPLRRFFKAPVSFGCATNDLLISREDLQLTMRAADPVLCDILEKRVREFAQSLPGREDLVGRVKRLLAEELVGGDPSLESVASRLATSARTLRRWLREAQTSHRELLDGLRRDLALRHLSEGRVPIAELAQILGYSEPSAFHRSFRRWTGRCPAEYRRELHQASRAGQAKTHPGSGG
jgi:DNA-binding NarL/FixJ family response regulator/AraC-like DNA-binding protein